MGRHGRGIIRVQLILIVGSGTNNSGKAIQGESANGQNPINWDPDSWLFTLTVDSTHTLDLSGFSFDQNSGTKGPDQWSLTVTEGANTLFSSPLAALNQNANLWTNCSAALNILGKTNTMLSFALLGQGARAGNPWNIDNFNLNGGVGPYPNPIVPIPAAVWLFGSGLAGLIASARRK